MEPAGQARVERRLAAILAADVAGYSRLIEANEEGTLRRLKALRAELTDPKISEHRGRIVKTTGDGDLAFEDIGKQALKNILRPVRVYRVRPESPHPSPPPPAGRRAWCAGGGCRAADAAAPRQAVDRGAALRQYERGPRAGVFRRRHGRGDHHRALPHPLAVRDRPQFELHLQGSSR